MFILFGCKVKLKILPRLSIHCETIFVLFSPHSTGMHAIVKVGESQDLAPCSLHFFFFQRSVARLWFYCSFAKATGADYYWVITRQDDEG